MQIHTRSNAYSDAFIPRAARASMSIEDLPASGGGQPSGATRIETRTVFVVECDRLVQTEISDGLNEAGYAIEAFADFLSFLQSHRSPYGRCVLIDAAAFEAAGFGLINRLKADELPTIVMSAKATLPMAMRAMRAGAADFLEWPFRSHELVAAVARTFEETNGDTEQSIFKKSACRSVARLTARQHEVMDLVVAGHASKNIAADLGISQRTVESHRANIASKTGAKSLPAMIHTALCANCSLGASAGR